MSMNNFVSTTEQMTSVREALDKAPAGSKKVTAQTHYQAAEKAHTAQRDADCLMSLEAATAALA